MGIGGGGALVVTRRSSGGRCTAEEEDRAVNGTSKGHGVALGKQSRRCKWGYEWAVEWQCGESWRRMWRVSVILFIKRMQWCRQRDHSWGKTRREQNATLQGRPRLSPCE